MLIFWPPVTFHDWWFQVREACQVLLAGRAGATVYLNQNVQFSLTSWCHTYKGGPLRLLPACAPDHLRSPCGVLLGKSSQGICVWSLSATETLAVLHRELSQCRVFLFNFSPVLSGHTYCQVYPCQVHLCVTIMHYHTWLCAPRQGVCTSYLASLTEGGSVCFMGAVVVDSIAKFSYTYQNPGRSNLHAAWSIHGMLRALVNCCRFFFLCAHKFTDTTIAGYED